MDFPILATLFLTFFRIGLFTFGGGYAMIPIIEDICVERQRWITQEDMTRVTVIAESTPGPIAINCATYIGFRQAGFLGAVAATFGVVLPSFLLIYAISMFLENFLEITIIANAFRGIRIAVGILIVRAGFKMRKAVPNRKLSLAILICAFVFIIIKDLFSLPLSTITLMLTAAAVSLFAALLAEKGGAVK